ncbi:outer membrane beta-barrel protein [Chryseobacterium salviniae]|uniref:Outer membrane beta-barrel protein n=1 Tax=Chryseobacterium salviniae TaxID=3101750 RepID=A0ABU6HX54_9FLAO|nr:outer membrane beta-barrel protein [Chryseobacterium sp. T9W2-O]MEC3876547.1 outer membrane beta-barrel protein [Chryseobacterium sp. T9W2-O]
MNNDWLNDLRMKMEDHTEDIPDGLWRNIREELFVEDETEKIPGPVPNGLKAQKAVIEFNRPLMYRIVGVAAAVILFLILGGLFDFTGKRHKPEFKKQYTAREDFKNENITKPTNSHSIEEIDKQLFSSKQKGLKKGNSIHEYFKDYLPTMKLSSGIYQVSKSEINLQNKTFSENQLAQKEDAETVSENPFVEEKEKSILLTKEERKMKEEAEKTKKLAFNKIKRNWMLGFGTANASSGSSDQFPGYATLTGATPTLPEIWSLGSGEDPLMSILLANQDKKVDATIKHKTPITFGVSVYKNVGKKWSIGTGINYTRLSAELTSGSQSDFISSEQNIHYVGIPVQVNYNIIQKGAFTGYVTAGGTIEKAVSGNIKTKYIVDGTVKQDTKEEIREKPIQVSVNSAAGVQLRVVKNIGIFAEPGIGYHFKDNSSLKTIYKEKPLNFNVKFGVRIVVD